MKSNPLERFEDKEKLYLNPLELAKNHLLTWDPVAAAQRETQRAYAVKERGISLYPSRDFRNIISISPEAPEQALPKLAIFAQQYSQERDNATTQDAQDSALARLLGIYARMGTKHREGDNPAGVLASIQPVFDFLASDGRDFVQLPDLLKQRILNAFHEAVSCAITYEHDFGRAKHLLSEIETKLTQLSDSPIFDLTKQRSILLANQAVVVSRFDQVQKACEYLVQAEPINLENSLSHYLISVSFAQKIAAQEKDSGALEEIKASLLAVINFVIRDERCMKLAEARKNLILSELQSEILVATAALGEKDEYHICKNIHLPVWQENLADDQFALADLETKLLLAEARNFPENSKENYLAAISKYEEMGLAFHAAETKLEILEQHIDEIGQKQSQEYFHETWNIFEKLFNRRLVAEWQKQEETSPFFQRLILIFEKIYNVQTQNPLHAWQIATKQHGKYLERKLHGEAQDKLDLETEFTSFDDFAQRVKNSFDVEVLCTKMPTNDNLIWLENGWQIEFTSEELSELKKTGSLAKQNFFADSKNRQPIGSAIFFLHGQQVYILHRGEKLLPLSELDQNILQVNLRAGLESSSQFKESTQKLIKEVRRPRSVSPLFLKEGDQRWQEAQEICGTIYAAELGFYPTPSSDFLPCAVNNSNGEIIGGAKVDHVSPEGINYPTIFMCCGGQDGKQQLINALEEHSVDLSDIVEGGGFFMTPEYRGDEWLAAHVLKIVAKQANMLQAKFIFLAYHNIVGAIFQKIGINPHIIQDVFFDESVSEKLKAVGMPDATIKIVEEVYFGRRVLQPIRAGLISVTDAITSTQNIIKQF